MNLRLILSSLAVAIVAILEPLHAAAAVNDAGEVLVYFGTYTLGKSKGIYLARLDSTTGQLSAPELAAEVSNPSFLAIHPSRRFLYAVNEVGNFAGRKTGAAAAFTIDRQTGKLTLLNQQPSGGEGPCHLNVDATGKDLLVANYVSGSCSVLPIGKDGQLGPATALLQHKGSSVNKKRQEGPHAHGAYFDARNRFAFVPDLGLDQVLIYKFDPVQGSLTPNDPPFVAIAPGSGPRHLAFHPSGKYIYLINEMLCTVTACSYDADRGILTPFQTVSTLPEGEAVQPSFSTAEIEVHPSGRFVYGSNRGHNTIAVFAVDETSGKLTLIQNQSTQGKVPRGFGIDPTGKYLLAANQDSDNVVGFRIDPASGRLAPTGQSVAVGTPVCVKFFPAAK